MASVAIETPDAAPESKPVVAGEGHQPSAKAVGKRKAGAPAPGSSLCVRRIFKELDRISKIDQRKEWAMELELIDENDVKYWRCKWYYDHASDADATTTVKRLAEQLQNRGLDCIEMRIVFPDNFPGEAPFVYNHSPRLVGTYIFSEGGICAETLSSEFGWSCASRVEALMITVRALLEGGGCRLQNEFNKDEKPNDEEGARRDGKSIANIHSDGWHGSAGDS